jgi:putative NIF3 family GTP cyclohydrolase 1 type 2
MKQPNGHEIIQLFEQFAPKHLAMEGDKIGLLIGSLNQKVKNLLIALDVTEEVVDEAIANHSSPSLDFQTFKNNTVRRFLWENNSKIN